MHQPRIGAFTLEIGVDASSPRRFLSLSLSLSLFFLSLSLFPSFFEIEIREGNEDTKRVCLLSSLRRIPLPLYLFLYTCIFLYI